MRKCSVFYGTLLALVLVSLGVKADNNGNENVRQRRRVSGRSSRKVIPGFRGITSLRFPYGVMSWITIPR